jgi:hypothetical protein
MKGPGHASGIYRALLLASLIAAALAASCANSFGDLAAGVIKTNGSGDLALVAVTGVTLSQSSLSLIAGGMSATLTATVSPSNATNAAVSWSTSEAAVATVGSSGVVTPIAAGSATITVTTADGGKTATCVLSVRGATGIAITNPSSINVSFTLASTSSYGSTISVTATASSTPDTVAWYLDDSLVSGQSSLNFSGGSNLGYGPHCLMVIVSKGGAYASDTHNFAVQ